METKQIALVGYGAMGQRIAAAIEAREGWELCGAIDPLPTPQCHASLEELPQVPHLIIDFSHPANLAMVCDYVQRHKVPCVIATTGYTPAQEAMCQELAAYAPVVRTQNTSLGINVMQQILKVMGSAPGKKGTSASTPSGAAPSPGSTPCCLPATMN